MVPEVRDMPYEDRLVMLNLWTLEERRNRANLVELFRMKQGFSGLAFEDFFGITVITATVRTATEIWATVITATVKMATGNNGCGKNGNRKKRLR